MTTGVKAVPNAGNSGSMVALRANTDALPMADRNELLFQPAEEWGGTMPVLTRSPSAA
jgi:metal-dependent amidase/aminoacylase/carboxypeptidase family protein